MRRTDDYRTSGVDDVADELLAVWRCRPSRPHVGQNVHAVFESTAHVLFGVDVGMDPQAVSVRRLDDGAIVCRREVCIRLDDIDAGSRQIVSRLRGVLGCVDLAGPGKGQRARPAGTAREALAEPTNPLSPAVTQPQHQPGQQPAAPLSDAQVSVGREAPSPPVLAVPATPLDVPAPPVVLLPAQANPVARIATARVRIAPADGQENLPQSLDRPPPPRAAFADRALPVHVLPVTITMNPEAQPQATNSLPVSDPSPTQTVNAPRQDFTALVERLIEARDTSSAHSVHAAIAHADFGQVSLHFQQDGKDLTVGMSSADPEFAVAVRAAMPADRSGLAAEGRPQSQSHSQSQGQSQGLSTGGSSSQHDEAGGRGNGGTADSQTRSGQGRNLRANANPAPATADLGQPKHRNGIFA